MKSIKKFLIANKYIFLIFVVWRLSLFVPQIGSLSYLENQDSYLGGGAKHYLANPILWGWANFDGEHYLGIAQFGYRPLTYFFFPLFPLLIRLMSEIVGVNQLSMLWSGLFISHGAFLVGLIGLNKLLKLDFKSSLIKQSIILLLLFPSSFYFAAVYTESIFLALVVWCFYLARNKNWFLAACLAGFASATRLVGIVLLPALFIEYLLQNKQLLTTFSIKKLITNHYSIMALLIAPLGLLIYMLYLNQLTGDPLAFFHSVEIFGQQRSTNLVLLPQVFYRYIFKIVPYVPITYWQGFFTTWLELATGLVFFGLSILAFWKVRTSYTVFLFGIYLIPTLSGSFSSLPRYVLVGFPGFIISAMLMSRLPKGLQYVIYIVLLVSLCIAESLFFRGYWLS